jgi:hypothetical protein
MKPVFRFSLYIDGYENGMIRPLFITTKGRYKIGINEEN